MNKENNETLNLEEEFIKEDSNNIDIIDNMGKLKIFFNKLTQQAFFFELKTYYYIVREYKIIPFSIGTLKTHSKQNLLKTEPFILNLNETIFLFLK